MVGQGVTQDDAEQQTEDHADGTGDVDGRGPQPTALVRGHLGQVGLGGRQLTAVGEALDESGDHQQHRCPCANLVVGRGQGDDEGTDRCEDDGKGQGVLATDLVGEPSEEGATDGPGHEADGEDRHRRQEGRGLVAAVEELGRDEDGEDGVDVPVVPFQRVSDSGSGEGLDDRLVLGRVGRVVHRGRRDGFVGHDGLLVGEVSEVRGPPGRPAASRRGPGRNRRSRRVPSDCLGHRRGQCPAWWPER